jgi:hypothetical protein
MNDQSGRYVDQVMSFFGLRNEAEPDSDSSAPNSPSAGNDQFDVRIPRKAAATPDPESRKFDARLAEFGAQLRSGGSLVAGRIHMVNLDKVRERLGDRWPKFAKRVHETVKTELKIRLSPRDFFRQVGEESYVIVFGDCSEVEARLKISLLSEQILEKLLGEAEAKDIEVLGVQKLVAKADGSVAGEALANVDSFLGMLDEAQRTGTESSTFRYADAAAGRRALTQQEVDKLIEDVDAELDDLERDDGQSGAPVIKIDRLQALIRQLGTIEEGMRGKGPAFSSEDASEGGDRAKKIRPSLKRVQEARGRAERQIVFLYDRAPEGGSQSASEVSFKVEFQYLPMWHTMSNMVAVHVCQPVLRDETGKAVEDCDLGGTGKAEVLKIVDRLTLRKVRDDLTKAIEANSPNIMIAPVHFATLHHNASQASFLDLCRELTEGHRRMLGWEIFGSHHESWSLQLKPVIEAIQPFGRAIFVKIDNMQGDLPGLRRNLPYLRSAGVNAVCVDVSTLYGSEVEKLQFLEQLAEWAEQSGLKFYGHGFDTLSMTISAVCMGYYSVSGPAIAAMTQRPVGVRKNKMENIYGRMLFHRAVIAT